MIDPISGRKYSEELIKRAAKVNSLEYESLIEDIKRGKVILLENGKILRRGYTTGLCAAAAAKAAASLLIGKKLEKVTVKTPVGVDAEMKVEYIDETTATACVRVDSGDYKGDALHGILICASAKHSSGFSVKAGKGIGIVRKPGFDVEVNMPDICPHALRSIEENVKAVASDVEIEIFVPNGEEIAKKTSLSSLGIEGGIPIFGTTGFIEPYTNDDYKYVIEDLVKNADDVMGISSGSVAKQFAVEKLSFPEDKIVVAGNFLMYAVQRCQARRKVIFIMPGKLCKILGVNLHQHFNFKFTTADELVAQLKRPNPDKLQAFFTMLAKELSLRVNAEVYVFDFEGDVLAHYAKSP